MDISKYLSNKSFNRGIAALDIKHRNITGLDIDELIKAIHQAVADKTIEDPFLHSNYQKKNFWEWNEEYLDSLYSKSFSECFDADYLKYLDKVAGFVNRKPKYIIGGIILFVVAAVMIVVLTVHNCSKNNNDKTTTLIHHNQSL